MALVQLVVHGLYACSSIAVEEQSLTSALLPVCLSHQIITIHIIRPNEPTTSSPTASTTTSTPLPTLTSIAATKITSTPENVIKCLVNYDIIQHWSTRIPDEKS